MTVREEIADRLKKLWLELNHSVTLESQYCSKEVADQPFKFQFTYLIHSTNIKAASL